VTSHLLAAIWEAVTGKPYYTGQEASLERGLPPSVTSDVAYADLPEQLRHELWLRAKATDAAGRAAIAAELAVTQLPDLASAGRRVERLRR
jgi:hypothetical protein